MTNEEKDIIKRFEELCDELEMSEQKVEIRDVFILINETSRLLYEQNKDADTIGAYAFTLLNGLKKHLLKVNLIKC